MICPCCSESLLRHVGAEGVYWYCLSCRQVMPNLMRDVKGDRPTPSSNAMASLRDKNCKQPPSVLWVMVPLRPDCA